MLLKLIGRYFRPQWPLVVGVVVLQLAQTLAALYLPTLNADIINNGVSAGDTGYILGTGGWMLLISALQVFCSIGAVWCGARAAMAVGRDLRGDVYRSVAAFSERELSAFGAPSLITRGTNDVQQVQMLVLIGATMLVSAPLTCIGGIILALQQDVALSGLIAVAVPILVLIMVLIIGRMVPLFQQMQDRIDGVNSVLRGQLTGIRVVRAFVREPEERARFEDANTALTQTSIDVGKLFAIMFPAVMLVFNISSIAVIWFGAFRVEDGSLQVGTLTAFLSYLMQILMAITMASFMAVMIPRAVTSANRLGEVLDTVPSVPAPAAPRTDQPEPGALEFTDAAFAYPGAESPVLAGISFRVEPGTTTAIIGSTGSGKTTLVSLIPRLFDVTAGTVRVGGVDVRETEPDTLRRRIGYIPQKPFLFSGTVASNLRFGRADASVDELWAALKLAQAEDFVRAMDGGLEGTIAQGGTNVSGGQRQRLAIARALIAGADIVVFDDSFSALDLRTDARLRRGLAENMADTTMVVVAQRVSTISEADQIIVLDDGGIVGRGTHEELLENCPTYIEIVHSQQAAEENA